jgi:hypothetical protein
MKHNVDADAVIAAVKYLLMGYSLEEAIEETIGEYSYAYEDLEDVMLSLASKIAGTEPATQSASTGTSMEPAKYFKGVADGYGWVTLEQAATDLGVSEQSAAKLARDNYADYIGEMEGSNFSFDDEEWDALDIDEMVIVM